MSKKIKIGIDYHGVISANPDFFREFTSLAIAQGCEIYIISGGFRKDIENYMQKQNIAYSEIWSMVDYFAERNMVSFFADGSFKVDDNAWDKAKAVYCLENHIDIHIDDSLWYGESFQTPFCLYDIRRNGCLLLNKTQTSINFNQVPEQVLADILQIIA